MLTGTAATATVLLASNTTFAESIPETLTPKVIVNTQAEPVASGRFAPTWESLKQYQVPEWFRDAKFGIWAHWGSQCQPEEGDWYARGMYQNGKLEEATLRSVDGTTTRVRYGAKAVDLKLTTGENQHMELSLSM